MRKGDIVAHKFYPHYIGIIKDIDKGPESNAGKVYRIHWIKQKREPTTLWGAASFYKASPPEYIHMISSLTLIGR